PPPLTAPGGVLPSRPFSDEALARARAAHRPVFAWFTADWCLTCKVNEQVAIERATTRDAFARAGVVVLRGDWTRRDPAITRYLTARGA
ncbi:thioredoxin family protein, partial [Acinetobacter baumannii]